VVVVVVHHQRCALVHILLQLKDEEKINLIGYKKTFE
jgi:hypothetical protein